MPSSPISLPVYQYYELQKTAAVTITEHRDYREKDGVGELLYEIISPEGIHFWHYSNNTKEKKTFKIENPFPFIQIVFSIYNNSTYKSGQEKTSLI